MASSPGFLCSLRCSFLDPNFTVKHSWNMCTITCVVGWGRSLEWLELSHMTQSSVLERFKGKGAQLLPAAMFPWSRPAAPSAQVSPGLTQDVSTGQNSDDCFSKSPGWGRRRHYAEEDDKCSHMWGTRLDFRFIGEEKGCSTMSHQTSLSQVQQHQYSQALGQSDTRSPHGMILPSEPQPPPPSLLLISATCKILR